MPSMTDPLASLLLYISETETQPQRAPLSHHPLLRFTLWLTELDIQPMIMGQLYNTSLRLGDFSFWDVVANISIAVAMFITI